MNARFKWRVRHLILGMAGVLALSVQALFAATVKVLVVYDTTGKTWVDANGGGMNAFAANAIARMNLATANSGIDLTFVLACATNVPYTQSGDLQDDLHNLQAGSGNLSVAHQLRTTYEADLVTMLMNDPAGGPTGYGYVLTSLSGSPDYGFTVCSVWDVATGHTLTHEVGHNLGADHSKYQASYPGPNTPLNSYSAGWYFTGNNSVKYHTIMAYNYDGTTMYQECPYFSTPLKTYQGVATGHAVNGDNARTLRETMAAVAAYRPAANRAPSRPTLTSPASGATGLSLTPTLQASAFSDPDFDTHANSRWQVDDNSTCDSPVWDSGESGAAGTSITVPAGRLAYNTTYYWRVRYKDSRGAWSLYASPARPFTTQSAANTSPSTPTLSSPANGATGQSLTPTLQASAFSDPNGDPHANSQWQVDNNNTFASPEWDGGESGTAAISVAVPAGRLANGTVYNWRVRYKDNRGAWSAWSGSRTFTTLAAANTAPATPTLTSPANGATGQSLTPTLQASAFSDPNGDTHANSQWQVDNSASFSGPEWDSGESAAAVTTVAVPAGRLANGTLYAWRVRYKDNRGAWSAWSGGRLFTTLEAANTAPATPTLTSPANDATGQSLTPTLQASAFSDPNGDPHANSQWQVDNNNTFTSPEWDSGESAAAATSTAVPASRLANGTLYYWRVRYKDNRGLWSAWSALRNFTTLATVNNPPATPTLSSPANGAIGQGLTPTLQASGFSDPNGDTHANSQWQVDNNSTFASPEWDSGEAGAAGTTVVVPASRLAYGTTYSWRVRYKDNRGLWSAWSVLRTFTTMAQPSNNHFANAIVISGSRGRTTGANGDATKETGEPNHAGVAGGKSVWWRWTAPASAAFEIDTAGSNFDTLLAVYTGSSVGALTAIASNDDSIGLQSKVVFNAVNGTTYRIAVDGYGGTGGNVTLNWKEDGAPGLSSPESDFDGDWISDATVFHPASGNWQMILSGSSDRTQAFGWSAVVPVPADYDGDGVVDLAVFHPAASKWYIHPSGGGADRAEAFGFGSVIPLPGDYDGDGKADLAVFHRPTSRWYFRYSSGGPDAGVAYGWSAVLPVPADYDGDGVVDLAVYNPGPGNWYVLESSTGNVVERQLGGGKALPVPADYDGDGKADVAVFTRATAQWRVSYSGGGGMSRAFGWAQVVPVPADYDGDGKADLAVYHPAGGKWYILQSSDQISIEKPLGGPGKNPVLRNYLLHSWFKLL